MTLFAGTSGWAYKEWKPDFYPADTPQSRFLAHYASVLPACEVNATFYRVPSPDLVARWVDQTPAGFRFVFKAHRSLTYAKDIRLTEWRKPIFDDFMAALVPAAERIGAQLWQYPAHVQRDDDALDTLLPELPARCGLEFRHESWHEPDVVERVAQAGATLVVSDTTGDPPESLPPGPIAYVRLRAGVYDADKRSSWSALLRAEAKERDVFAFIKHEGVAADDPAGGIAFARALAGAAA